jgi:hypothetical protein
MKKGVLLVFSLILIIGMFTFVSAEDYCKDNTQCHVDICKKNTCTNLTVSEQNSIVNWSTCDYPTINAEKCQCVENKCQYIESTPTNSTCQPTRCDDGMMNKCEVVNGICTCSTCPPKPTMPRDMDSCLDNPNYYWDQQTNSCLNYYPGCIDPDGGKNIFEQAHTFGLRSSYADSRDKRIITGGLDSCTSNKQIIEHYCDENGFIQTAYLDCPNGCKDGVCIKGEPITEKITCKFEGASKEQRCYLAGQFTDEDLGTKYCAAGLGSSSCVIDYTGYAGEKITWKSTCGQYQYTTQDGSDEVIYFKCSEGETNISEIVNKGFTNVYFKCYDGYESKSTDREACKSADYWQKFAANSCDAHCDEKSGKCGVNSFSIGNECYLDHGSCPMPSCSNPYKNGEFDENGCPIVSCFQCKEDSECQPSCGIGVNCSSSLRCIEGKCVIFGPTETEINTTISEPALVCKDSCPLDGKCYPMGYRKSGQFCSDSGGFVDQKKTESCDNNFECSSNVCVNSQCVSSSLIDKIIGWFKSLFGGG